MESPQNHDTRDPETLNKDSITLTISHHGKPHMLSLPSDATVSDLSALISSTLSVPASNQKLMIPKLGLLKPPFKDPSLPISTFPSPKITLMGATVSETSEILSAAAIASRTTLRAPPKQTAKAYKTHNWAKEQEESTYIFSTLRPLPYLPNPSRSLQFLERLRDDPGINASMRKHKWTVPLLTEMNPIEHTSSTHEGTTRTLGLNRNRGEVIELRLRTDAYDGYRDYKTIRKTLCHELAHNVWGDHDRNFWDLCKEIEKEVEKADWKSGGRAVGEEEFAEGHTMEMDEDEVDDEGGWKGGEFLLGAGLSSGGMQQQGISRREILANAAEARIKRLREQEGRGSSSPGGSESESVNERRR